MTWEPRPQRGSGLDPKNPYQDRWRPWYSSIADWMMRNPAGTAEQCAREIGRAVNTVRYIMATDMFRDYFARRREEWQRSHDWAILSKTTQVAERALDLMSEKLEKQGDKIPMNLVTEVAVSALDRLGYAPKSTPSVQVNVNEDNRKVVMVPISTGALEEARDAIRQAEQARAAASARALLEAEPVKPSGEVSGEQDDPFAVLDPDYRS